MRSKGIHYDTGTFPAGRSSRPGFHPDDVRRDLVLIADELRCDAVRITGGELDRITLAATCAADAGLEVWYSPHPCELDAHGMAALFDEAASRAETVRARSRASGRPRPRLRDQRVRGRARPRR